MIYFFSGTPGSGKSLHAAKMIDQWVRRGRNVIANFDINENFWDKKKIKNRGVINCLDNTDLNIDYLIKFADIHHKRNNKGQIKERQTLLIIDECQTMFNSRSWNTRGRDRWVIFFTQHRKYGFEVLLISQNKDLVDKQIRGCFEYNYKHRNARNFKLGGALLAMLCGGNCIVVSVDWMLNGKHDHTEWLFGMRKYYSLYDSYRIFDTTNLRRLSALPGEMGVSGAPTSGAGPQAGSASAETSKTTSPT